MAKELVMLKINSAMIQNVTAIGDGSAFAVYDSTEVDMSGVSVSSCHAGGSGTIYLEGGEGAYLADLSMKLNSAGEYGGAILLNGTRDVIVTRSVLYANEAPEGAAMACTQASSGTTVTSVTMTGKSNPDVRSEVWSDGTCLSSFWSLPTSCNTTCDTCAGSVCSETPSSCECYCTGLSC